MIRLHYANRLENLVAPLADAIASQQRVRPLDPVTIVVPSRVIEHFLKHRVAERIGVAANLDFPFLRRFFAKLIETAEPKLHILDVEELELVLFESLRAAIGLDELRAPRIYIENGQPTDAEKEIRTFRLARQLARLFREYSIARRSMLQRWMKNPAGDGELSENEKWQRRLWMSTFGPNGVLRGEWKADDTESRWMLLPEAFDTVATSSLKAALPKALHVFGLAYVGPAYLRILSQIGKLTDLHIYALNPCLEFWEDVEPLSRSDRESWARRFSKVGSALEESIDPFNLDAARDTPALRLWARPGREYIRMLNELTECDFDPHFTLAGDRMTSLLGSLQEDILNRAPQRSLADSDPREDDASIRFLACPGIAREAEIVANEIWSMLERDARGRDAIRFHQIAVMVPDALYSDYLPHLESAFSRLHQLPMNIVNRGSISESPVREAISLLLRLPLGRFSRDEMLHLLNHPVIRGEEAEIETEQATRWCEELGIFFGADANDLSNTYIPPDAYHWDQGLRRMALGVFLSREADQEPRFYEGPASIEYLPYSTTQDESGAVATFIRSARGLLADAVEIRSARLTLAQWSQRLSDLILKHIEVDDPVDDRIRERCIQAIESIARPELRSAPVSYQIAYEALSARMAELESQGAQFTEHGIAIGPLSALRTIPFRAIFMLGLNESQFPERDRREPMDLRIARRRAGDVSPTERDRYLFLETLLAARERICLSYTARNAKTGDQLDPSSVILELQFILRGYVNGNALDSLTIKHPLSRYDRRYFPNTDPDSSENPRDQLVTYDDEARRGAAMAALRRDLAHHCGNLPLPGRDEPVSLHLSRPAGDALRPSMRLVEVPSARSERVGPPEILLPIAALRKFLECPLQGAAQYALGMFDDDRADLEQWQDEPVAQSILDRTTLLREVFWKVRADPALLVKEYSKAFRISQLAGSAPAGPFADAARRTDYEDLERWFEHAERARCGSLARWIQIRVGRGDEPGKADRILPELVLPLRGGIGGSLRDCVVRLQGSLGFISPNEKGSLRLVLRDGSKVKDFLGGFVAALVLAASGDLAEQRFDAIVIGAGNNKSWSETQSLDCPTADVARGYLSDLVSDLLFARNHYFLPIEAVEDVAKEMSRGHHDLLDVIYDARDNEFSSCSSDYGPIRNARRFDPPSIEILQRIMSRRFGLIRGIFDKPEKH